MKNSELLTQLTDNLQPVSPPESAGRFALKSGFGALLFVVVVIFLVSPREDLISAFQQRDLWLQLSTFTILLFSALFVIAWSGQPGRREPLLLARLILGLVAISGLVQLARVFGVGQVVVSEAAHVGRAGCSLVGLAFGAATSVFLMRAARRAASTQPWRTGLFVGLAGAAVAGVAVTLHCANRNELHLFLWHFLVPMVVMNGAGFFIGQKWLRW